MNPTRPLPRTSAHVASRRRSAWRTLNPTAWLFVLPAAALYLTFHLIPFIETIWLGFEKWDGASPTRQWVGLENYAKALQDGIFWKALSHNLVFMAMDLVLPLGIGLVLAVFIANVRRGRTAYRFLLFMPYVLSLAIVGIIWGEIYDPNIGVINQSLKAIGMGVAARPWLADPATVLVAVNFAGVWHGFPFAMILYVAGLQGVDSTLYDAARMDGANGLQTFRHVTIPGLTNVTTLLVASAFIGALTAFTLVWSMTGGGPYYATEVISTYIYKAAFEDVLVGYGAALSVALALIALLIAGLFVWLRERGE